MSGRSAFGSGGSDRRAIARVECLIRIRASACLFFSVGALWPVACGVPCPRTKWSAKSRAPAVCFVRYRDDLRGRKSSSKKPSQVRRQQAQATGQRAPQRRRRGKLMLKFLLNTLHTRSPYDRTHHSHARCVHSHRLNASSGPRELPSGHIDGRRPAAGTTRERHGSSTRGSSRMSPCALRARAMELISRGMGQNQGRSARATYLENAYGSATRRVLSDGAEMADELGTRARVCGRAAADLISVPWHPMPRLGGRVA